MNCVIMLRGGGGGGRGRRVLTLRGQVICCNAKARCEGRFA